MKPQTLPTLFTALLLTLPTATLASPGKGHGHGLGHFKDYARVVSSVPIYEDYNEPRQECWTERVGHYHSERGERSYTGAIIGGIAGGLLGNQIGKGNGKVIATAVGAATGAMVGDSLDNDGRRVVSGPRYEERCRTVDNWTRRVAGYNVTYRYQGRDYSTVLPYDPGPSVRVRVRVEVDD